MGYSIVLAQKNSFEVREIDVLRLPAKKDHYERLQLIYKKITELCEVHSPDAFAIEAPFYGKNVQSMLKLGRAQGVAIAAAMGRGIPVTEYSPKKIKQSITGNGNAAKEQVWKMLQQITLLPDKPKYFDATDALAVAICHHFGGSQLPVKSATKKAARSKGSWESFIKENSHRIRT
jgi:crossover junction endodeoxyribonuclease RuvC